MKALFFDGALHFTDSCPQPDPDRDEALIRVEMAGICGTDLEITRGYKGFKGILGHEFVGIVESVNGCCQDIVGKRVVGELNCGCGGCEWCLKGLSRHCIRRTALGIEGREGAFAEYLTLPVRNLHAIPDNVQNKEAVFAEPLAAAFEITEQVHVKPDHLVLVLGDGRLGLLAAFVLAHTGARTFLAGKYRSKLAIAEAWGVQTTSAEELKGGTKYDVVVEATGSHQGLDLAIGVVKPRGTVVLKSTVAALNAPLPEGKQSRTDVSRIVVNEITVVGSRCGPFLPAIAALASGRIDVTPLISAVYPFEQAIEAFSAAAKKENIKVLLELKSG